ncbi:hypothetical protein GCM10010532_065700 [Dactylosporangium siamense]|uniref:Uncharacterized protein n=1 Tax=Dactylosporangium siamense TaxID=685454 RepID=A0A919PNX8_9ACTN|nr:hypothetical protein Dsi01nite_046970 [Dactylosporangium siamense]
MDRSVVALIAGVFAVLLGARLLGAEWVAPPEDGVGPFPSTGRAVMFWIVVAVAGLGAVACLLARMPGRGRGFPTLLLGIPLLIGIVVVLGEPIYNSHQVDLRAGSFPKDRYELGQGARIRFFNAGDSEITVCLGVSGQCSSTATGPARLLSPGITLLPNDRRAVTMPDQVGEYQLTIAGEGGTGTHRNTVINITEWD